jgi:hypothetical protein
MGLKRKTAFGSNKPRMIIFLKITLKKVKFSKPERKFPKNSS